MIRIAKSVFRYIRMTLAVCLILLGIIMTPLPIPLGLITIGFGIAWLMNESITFRKAFYRTARKWNFLDRQLDKIQHKLPTHLKRENCDC